jgi:DHA1 family bicyclomycin/chloramphenicol resistance-like MFS transporter
MQKKNRKSWLLVYLIFLTALPPLTTDMYLPALPEIVEKFHSTVGVVNLTLVLFFAFFSASILIWGTLSDKYGRRPILLICTGLYILSSLLCSIAGSISQLITFRVFQAIGGGATVAVTMAMMKDVFEGRERERALSIAGVFMVIAPITAPSIGALILRIMSWEGIFLVLSGFGMIALTGAIFMKETALKSPDKGLAATIGNLFRVLKNPGFAFPLPLFALMTFPIFMFIAASSDIYVSHYGLSEQSYSLLFGGNAVISAIGPVLYMIISRHIRTPGPIIASTFLLTLLSGVFVILLGDEGPLRFALTILPATIGASMIRPPGTHLLLEQVKADAGAASSLMNFTFVFIGSLGMQFISLDWDNRIFMIGLVYIITGLTSFLFWPFAWRRCKV